MGLTAGAARPRRPRGARRGRRQRRRHDRRASFPPTRAAGRELAARGARRRLRVAAARAVFPALDPDVAFDAARSTRASAVDDAPARSRAIEGPARAILTGERTALNLLGRLCGIATLTRALRRRSSTGTGATILDTRKTTPGLRALEKYAVRCGGGTNHRFGLYDAILLKENHLRIAGGIAPAVAALRATASRSRSRPRRSTRSREALAAGADGSCSTT